MSMRTIHKLESNLRHTTSETDNAIKYILTRLDIQRTVTLIISLVSLLVCIYRAILSAHEHRSLNNIQRIVLLGDAIIEELTAIQTLDSIDIYREEALAIVRNGIHIPFSTAHLLEIRRRNDNVILIVGTILGSILRGNLRHYRQSLLIIGLIEENGNLLYCRFHSLSSLGGNVNLILTGSRYRHLYRCYRQAFLIARTNFFCTSKNRCQRGNPRGTLNQISEFHTLLDFSRMKLPDRFHPTYRLRQAVCHLSALQKHWSRRRYRSPSRPEPFWFQEPHKAIYVCSSYYLLEVYTFQPLKLVNIY